VNLTPFFHRSFPFEYDDAVVELVASRCTESESGGRMIDAILTNSMLPEISREFLVAMKSGRRIGGVMARA
jgi:type VI secretion system protein VasG